MSCTSDTRVIDLPSQTRGSSVAVRRIEASVLPPWLSDHRQQIRKFFTDNIWVEYAFKFLSPQLFITFVNKRPCLLNHRNLLKSTTRLKSFLLFSTRNGFYKMFHKSTIKDKTQKLDDWISPGNLATKIPNPEVWKPIYCIDFSIFSRNCHEMGSYDLLWNL